MLSSVTQGINPDHEDSLRRQLEDELKDEEDLVQTLPLPGKTPELDAQLASAIYAIRHGGQPLPTRGAYESRLGYDFSDTRIHTDDNAHRLTARIRARAFTYGRHIVFGAGQYTPQTREGQKLIAHELTHVVQQTNPPRVLAPATSLHAAPELPDAGESGGQVSSLPSRRQTANETAMAANIAGHSEPQTVQLQPADTEESDALQLDEEHMPEDSGIPDEETVTEGIEWPQAQQLNLKWWRQLRLNDVLPIRSYDPLHQPRTWANKVYAAQTAMREAGIRRVEERRFKIDGVLGPRTLLALRDVAQDESHAARTKLQTLGFDLDAIAQAEIAEQASLAATRPAEFLLEWDFRPLGERVIRFYDLHYHMGIRDRRHLDDLFFDGQAPAGIRREDRIALLRRAYGRDEHRLQGRVAFVHVNRPFIHRIDKQRAVDRDRHTPTGLVFYPHATTQEQAAEMFTLFEQRTSLQDALRAADEETLATILKIGPLLEPQADGAPPRDEQAAFIFIMYFPELSEDNRRTIVQSYLLEKAERERQEEAARQAHNRAAAKRESRSPH